RNPEGGRCRGESFPGEPVAVRWSGKLGRRPQRGGDDVGGRRAEESAIGRVVETARLTVAGWMARNVDSIDEDARGAERASVIGAVRLIDAPLAPPRWAAGDGDGPHEVLPGRGDVRASTLPDELNLHRRTLPQEPPRWGSRPRRRHRGMPPPTSGVRARFAGGPRSFGGRRRSCPRHALSQSHTSRVPRGARGAPVSPAR